MEGETDVTADPRAGAMKLTKADRDRVDALLVAALGHPSAERGAFLDTSCPPGLRPLVERLLASAEDDSATLATGGALLGPLAASLVDSFDPEGAGAVGDRIGPYRIERELGRGGMAVVYGAERVDGQFEQRVALKLIKPGTDSEEVLRRFRQERQILAALDHPSIARLFDGGVSDDGRPYFALEPVDGQPVDRYCRQRGLTVEEKLRLFLEICDAVAHAHSRMVVHRDIKPSNILVTGEQRVKLLDFGIAKLLAPDAWPENAASTRTELRVLTPDYASPEQVRGEPATAATDVYQLGLLLYRLLTGRTPFLDEGSTRRELERRICHQTPKPPSAAVTGAAPQGLADPNGERTQSLRLRKQLRGDLDTIVLKALRKDPDRRYRSVERLAEDVVRFLDGRPVSARPDTLLYRAGKFLGRHAAAAVSAAAVVLLLALLVTVHVVRLGRERDRAQREADKSAQVSRFVQGLFAVPQPEISRGEAITARDLLDRGVESLDRELGDQPELLAAMLSFMGETYTKLDLLESARPLLERTVEIQSGVFGEDHPEVAKALTALGLNLYRSARFTAAGPIFERALAIQESALGPRDPAVALTLHRLGNLRKRLDDLDGARALLERALAIQETALGPMDAEVAKTLNSLGLVLGQADDLEAARASYERAIAIHQEVSGPDSPLVATSLDNLGHVLRRLGDLEGAREVHERALTTARRAYGREHSNTAVAANSLALVLARLGRHEEARSLYEEAIATYERAFGEDHPWVSYAVFNLADLLRETGELEAARPLYERALRLRLAAFGEEHSLVAIALVGQAKWWQAKGDTERAEALHRQALAVRRKVLPEGSVGLARSLVDLGSLLTDQGDPAAAEPLLREGLEHFRRARPAGHEEVIRAQQVLERCLALTRRPLTVD